MPFSRSTRKWRLKHLSDRNRSPIEAVWQLHSLLSDSLRESSALSDTVCDVPAESNAAVSTRMLSRIPMWSFPGIGEQHVHSSRQKG